MDEIKRAELALQRARQKGNEAARKEWLGRLEAAEAEKRKDTAAKAEAARVKHIEQVKSAKWYQAESRGMTKAAFEKAWPEILKSYQLGTDDGFGPESIVAEITARKRASGVYGNLG